MTELRHDALTGRLVLLAPDRYFRPRTNAPIAAGGDQVPACPFCPGHEAETPPEVARTGAGSPNGPGWRVRVVPNLYPIVGGPDAGPGATGAHEVAILSPDHGAGFGALAEHQAGEVLTVLRDRARVHGEAGRAHVQVLLNEGRAAGASIAHPHAQILGLDVVPPAAMAGAGRFASAGSDLVLDDHAAAVAAGTGVLGGGGGDVGAWCPVGSASPFEVRIAALSAGPNFETATDAEVQATALVLRDVLAALGRALDDPPYNVVVHNAAVAPSPGEPSSHRSPDHGWPYHWWVEVVPRVGVVAGFELGTGILVNTMDPKAAAGRLREMRASAT